MSRKYVIVTAILLFLVVFGCIQKSHSLASHHIRFPPNSPLDEQNFEFVGQLGGATYDVAIQGNYAYVGVGPRMVILDIQEPGQPTKIGETEVLPAVVKHVDVSENIAYITTEQYGIFIVDISVPLFPKVVGVFNEYDRIEEIVVVEDYVYIAAYSSGMKIVDVTDPTQPQRVGVIGVRGVAVDIAVRDGIAYIASGEGGLRIIDITDPENPTEIGSLDPGYDVEGLALGENWLITHCTSRCSDNHIVDISDPAQPVDLGDFDLSPGVNLFSDEIEDIKVKGHIAYVIDYAGELQIVDVNDPTQPSVLGHASIPLGDRPFSLGFGSLSSIDIADDKAYISATGLGLRVYDIETSTTPYELGFYDILGIAGDIEMHEDIAYVGDAKNGLKIIDVSEPDRPRQLSSLNVPGDDNTYADKALAMSDGFAYILEDEIFTPAKMHIVDIASSMQPQEISILQFETNNDPNSVEISSDRAYVASENTYAGLHIIDVSDPGNLHEIGYFETQGQAYNAVVNDSVAYVLIGKDSYSRIYDSLVLVDVSDPANPQEIGFYEGLNFPSSLQVVGQAVYIADSMGLRIIDTSNPTDPTEIDSYPINGDALGMDVAIVGLIAFVTDIGGYITALDVSRPGRTNKVGYIKTMGSSRAISVNNRLIYIADGDAGMLILRYTGDLPVPTPTATPSPTPTPTPTPTPIPTDEFESDNTCNQAKTIQATGNPHVHTFHVTADADWVQFDASAGTNYLIEAQPLLDSPADLVMETYIHCNAPPPGQSGPRF